MRKTQILTRLVHSRLAIAGAGAALVAALAVGPRPAPDAAPVPAPPAATSLGARLDLPADPNGARSYSYYPEQLAALHAMNNFIPVADAGLPPAAEPAAVSARTAPQRIVRRADQPLRVARAAEATAPEAAAEKPHAPARTRIFGLTLPGAPDLSRGVTGARDAVAGWGKSAMALGGKIASLWR